MCSMIGNISCDALAIFMCQDLTPERPIDGPLTPWSPPSEFMLQAGRSIRATIPIREPPPQDDAVLHPEAAPDAHEVARDLKGENASDAQAAGAVVEVGPSSETSTPRESGDTGASGGGTPEKKEKKISKLLRKLK